MSIYHLRSLVEGFGTPEAVGEAIADFRERVRSAGYGELHMNAVVWGHEILPGEGTLDNVNSLLDTMGFDSVTSSRGFIISHCRVSPRHRIKK